MPICLDFSRGIMVNEDFIYKKQEWKPGNMLYPVPAVMVTVADKKGRDNIITVAWTGTVCTNPPMVYISPRLMS